jgi:hypothetical protein
MNPERRIRVLSIDVGLRNLAMTIFSFPEHLSECKNKWQHICIEYWECLDVLEDNECRAKSSKTVSGVRCNKFLIDSLHKRAHLWHALDYTVIESQPMRRGGGRGNSIGGARNQVLAHILWTYFYTCQHNRDPSRIHMSSSKQKLAVGMNVDFVPDTNSLQVETYAQRKKEAIRRVDEILTWMIPENSVVWTSHRKKRDDLADSFLHGIYFIQQYCQPKPKSSTRQCRQGKKRVREEK